MEIGLTPNREVDEVKFFVKKSLEGCTNGGSRHIEFHKNLVAHYFEARNVEVYYEQKKVIAEILVGRGYVPLNFSCLDLPTFLCSCVKEDQKSLQIHLEYIRKFLKETAPVETS